MKFYYSFSLLLALIANTKAAPQEICLAKCSTNEGDKECVFKVSRNIFTSELGYYTFEGADGDCGGPNPTLGIEKGVTYRFIQEDSTNYYHPLGFAYGPDGALDDQDELEPGVAPPGSGSDCKNDLLCPAPMYILNGDYLGKYSNNADIAPITAGEDFGLDAYEPAFFLPVGSWIEDRKYGVALKFDVANFENDFFYFCHIHQYMSGRVKFVDSIGKAINDDNVPGIPYEYDTPSAYDQTCGSFGLEDFQLPNPQCPKKFVCDQPDPATPVGKYAECIESMNCAMLAGMTTNVNMDNALALFNHQMIPHHQNAVNMCKSLIFSGEIDCAEEDLLSEDKPECILKSLCLEIINGQNFQIQVMRGVLDLLGAAAEDDCVVPVHDFSTSKATKKAKKS